MTPEQKEKVSNHIEKKTEEILAACTDPEKIERVQMLRRFCLRDLKMDGKLSANVVGAAKDILQQEKTEDSI